MHIAKNLAQRTLLPCTLTACVCLLLLLPAWMLAIAIVTAAVLLSRLPMGRQTLQLAGIAATTFLHRLGSSSVVVITTAGVVGVLVALLSMGIGLEETLRETGTDDTIIVLGRGAQNETSSTLDNDTVSIISQSPYIARNGKNQPIVCPERLIVTSLPKLNTGLDANIAVRGVCDRAWDLRPDIRIVAGRRFEAGLRELMVGSGAHHQFKGLDIGAEVSIDGQQWRIVGVFDSGDAHNSELWGDVQVVGSAFRRSGIFTAIKLRVTSASVVPTLQSSLQRDPRLKIEAHTTRDFYGRQSSLFIILIKSIGKVIAAIMAIGAIFGALNATYSAINSRSGEIATLRAIGFRAMPVISSLLMETMLLSLAGGLLGAAVAWLLFDGFIASTYGSSGQVVFAFRVSPELLLDGVRWALAMGLVGGLVPAFAVVGLPISTALQAR